MRHSEHKGPMWGKSQPTFILSGHSHQLPPMGPYEAKTQTWKVVQRTTPRPYLWKNTLNPDLLHNSLQFSMDVYLCPHKPMRLTGVEAQLSPHDFETVTSLSLGFSFLTCKKYSLLTNLSHIASSKWMPLHHSLVHEADKNQIITPMRMQWSTETDSLNKRYMVM